MNLSELIAMRGFDLSKKIKLVRHQDQNYDTQHLYFNRKEIDDIESYTIEHIMPQNPNLSAEWRQDLGTDWEEVQNTYLHTLGNLTLTRYNSELSDKPFTVKRDMDGGFADSPLRLNRGLGKLSVWNKDEITKRAHSLADQAVKVLEVKISLISLQIILS
ncbi:HNH endonuclease family protein [Paenibacillus sp. FSL R5-0407]|uniref:HNH endonuclease family protein n=1 Tax=Paenibacillus sp. FSL R5-0407 TaxID=2975320 RepID=UPI0030F8993D